MSSGQRIETSMAGNAKTVYVLVRVRGMCEYNSFEILVPVLPFDIDLTPAASNSHQKIIKAPFLLCFIQPYQSLSLLFPNYLVNNSNYKIHTVTFHLQSKIFVIYSTMFSTMQKRMRYKSCVYGMTREGADSDWKIEPPADGCQ